MFRHADSPTNGQEGSQNSRQRRLSYKFQRLREQLREGVRNGDFGEKLPGERTLGRMFGVNAKTVNKALSDLAAEGLLERRIGQGTFVANAANNGSSSSKKGSAFLCMGSDGRHLLSGPLDQCLRDEGLEGAQFRLSSETRSGGNAIITLRDWSSQLRGKTNGLFFLFDRALSDSRRIDDRLLLQAQRRQTAMVAIGACADSPKINAIAADFVDGGFRLGEHLMRLGCQTVAVRMTAGTRETEAVLSGARTAAARYGCAITQDKTMEAQGLILIGSAAISEFLADETARESWRSGKLAVACFPDIADEKAANSGLTTYEVSIADLAPWAVKLMLETRPGRRPVEYLVPGRLSIRDTLGQTKAASQTPQSAPLPEVSV